MLDKDVIINRLAFIKYLYRVAVEQSQKSEPLCAASVLFFHDAVELFLQLAFEHLDIGKEGLKFMEYWDLISKKLGIELSQKESMRRLNRARVSLKHHGTLPSKLDIEAFRASSTAFFKENTPIIFGVDFSQISLIELIQYEGVKNKLKNAEKLAKENKIEEALDKVALAFAELIDNYEDKIIEQYGRNPFLFGRSMTFMSSFFMGLKRAESSNVERKLADFVDTVKESLENIQKTVKILSLGIDYQKYAKFQLFTPQVVRTASGKYHIEKLPWGSRGIPTIEDVYFCIDFVIESAISIQKINF